MTSHLAIWILHVPDATREMAHLRQGPRTQTLLSTLALHIEAVALAVVGEAETFIPKGEGGAGPCTQMTEIGITMHVTACPIAPIALVVVPEIL